MKYPSLLDAAARARVVDTSPTIQQTMDLTRRGRPLAAEPDYERLACRVQAKLRVSDRNAEIIATSIRQKPSRPSAKAARAGMMPEELARPEAIWGNTLDFLGIAFLQKGVRAARSVGRVAFRDGRPQGTGFLISDSLFITNNHVVSSRQATSSFYIEFDYELDPAGSRLTPTQFEIDAARCFITDDRDDLDYSIFALGQRVSGANMLPSYGFCPLSDAKDKHALGEVANIVQHPEGRLKEVVLRENRLAARLETVLHYVADTEPGASGSPVFNNEWQVIALHHWGGPWRQKVDDEGNQVDREVNEGIRTSAIVRELRGRLGELDPEGRTLLERALSLGESTSGPVVIDAPEKDAPSLFGTRVSADGSVTWRLPIEISVRIPALSTTPPAPSLTPAAPGGGTSPGIAPSSGALEALKPDSDYSDRSGYKPGFIKKHPVPLPQLGASIKNDAAPNQEAETGDDPNELKYHHFSVVMNKKRKLAFFTACNIDGSKSKKVDRATGAVSVLRVDDPGLESFSGSEGAEASELWFLDARLSENHQTPLNQYADQKVPGVPVSSDPRRLPRMFQRGHLVRRMDPAWGNNDLALRADADTFHVTNCTPQIGFFNMGTARPLNLPKTERGTLWRALENYVLRNAVEETARISCFTGPVLGKQDPKWRGINIPLKFWKIVVWASEGELHSLAMIANQQPVLKALAGLPEDATSAEAFAELDKVDDFLTTVTAVETLTNLNFGDAVRNADVRGGQENARIKEWGAVPLVKKKRAKPKVTRNKTRKPPR